MKKSLLLLPIIGLFLCSFVVQSRAVTYNGVYADSNNIVLPGFTIPASQVFGVVPTGNLSSNVMQWSSIASTGVFGVGIFGSNVVANAVTVSNVNGSVTLSNGGAMASCSIAVGYGTNLAALYSTPGAIYASNCLETPLIYAHCVGGTNNHTSAEVGYPNNANSAVFGGVYNFVDGFYNGASDAATGPCCALGGAYNTVGSYCMTAVGGQGNTLMSGGWGAIVAGRTNLNAQENGVIVGGINNLLNNYSLVMVNGRNNVIVGGHNNLVQMVSNSVAGGCYAQAVNQSTFVWADDQGTNVFGSGTNNAFVVRVRNGMGINTNYPGTNALRVFGNGDFSSLSLGGVDLYTAFPLNNASNSLYTLLTYNLNVASNALQTQISTTTVSNMVISLSNTAAYNATLMTNYATAMTNYVTATSNSLSAQISSVTSAKAFSFTLSATYASQGIGFNTPLMPDANYSVGIIPDDQTTAESPLKPWISSKTASGFTINVGYATNYDMHWDCVIKENSQ